ncbi:MAG: hypothetical protein ACQESP_13115 [Candidatus Muiribacteriota bacterium]
MEYPVKKVPVKKVSVKIITIHGMIIGTINISGFCNFSEYMDNDNSSYLKIFDVDIENSTVLNFINNDGNFILLPKSKDNIYIPFDN